MESKQSLEGGHVVSPRRVSFKYRSGSAALRCLSEGSAYFASPSDLNDSLEAKFENSSSADYMASLDRAIKNLAKERGGGGQYEILSHDVPSYEAWYESDSANFLKATQRVGIYSTASRPDNQPMWAYYCENSKGFCFELEWPDEVLGQYQIAPSGVLYSSKARVHNRADMFGTLIQEEAERHPDWSMDRILEEVRSGFFSFRFEMMNIWRATSIKHSDWAHEREVRFITPKAGPLPILSLIHI